MDKHFSIEVIGRIIKNIMKSRMDCYFFICGRKEYLKRTVWMSEKKFFQCVGVVYWKTQINKA